MRPLPATALLLSAVLTALLTTSCSAQQDVRSAPAAAPTSAPATPSATPSPAAPAPRPSAAGATITISSFEYLVPAQVRPGERITVVNEDREAHTVTVDRGAVRLTVLPGATAVLDAPAGVGEHAVTCDLHGGMDAVLVVA